MIKTKRDLNKPELNDSANVLLAVSDNMDTIETSMDEIIGASTDIITTANQAVISGNVYAVRIASDPNEGKTLYITSGATYDVATYELIGNSDLYERMISTASNSGAKLIGTYDEFANSNSTNVQDVLDDLDQSITDNGTAITNNAGAISNIADGTTNMSQIRIDGFYINVQA